MKSAKRGSKREQTITQAHDTWMIWRAQTLEPMSCDTSLQVGTNTRKRWRVRCTVYTPRRLQQIAISCKRSCCNKFKKKSSTSFYPTATMKNWKKMTDATFGIDVKGWVQVALLQIRGGDCSSIVTCFSEVWSEFHRCILARFVQCETPIFFFSHTPQRMGSWSGLPLPIYPLRYTSPRSSQFLSCESRFSGSRWKRSWIPTKSFLIHLFRALWTTKCSFCAVPSTVESHLLGDVVRNWVSIQSPLTKILTGFAFNQEMSTGAIDHSLIPIKKAFWALHFWNCFAQLE